MSLINIDIFNGTKTFVDTYKAPEAKIMFLSTMSKEDFKAIHGAMNVYESKDKTTIYTQCADGITTFVSDTIKTIKNGKRVVNDSYPLSVSICVDINKDPEDEEAMFLLLHKTGEEREATMSL